MSGPCPELELWLLLDEEDLQSSSSQELLLPTFKKKVLEPRVKETCLPASALEPARTNITTRHTQRDPSQHQDPEFDEQHQRSKMGQPS